MRRFVHTHQFDWFAVSEIGLFLSTLLRSLVLRFEAEMHVVVWCCVPSHNDIEEPSRSLTRGAFSRICPASLAQAPPSCPRRVAVVTTAALPWLTGTSVNAALRAAHLCRRPECEEVQLVVPWLAPADQAIVMRQRFDTPQQQEAHIRAWLRKQVDFDESRLRVRFYAGRYVHHYHSVLGVGDVTRSVDSAAELVVLEEPEHLNWFHHGRAWLDAFPRVVGVIHTNYVEYANREPDGAAKAFGLHHYNRLMAYAYCDGVVRLSGAVQDFPRQRTCNINGVSDRYLRLGRARGAQPLPDGAYIIAKMQWGKAYTELLDLVGRDRSFNIDVYGSGDDAEAIVTRAEREGLPMRFFGARAGQGRYDHTDAAMRDYRVFVNPSLSDVVCTATAEALAMGKFVVVPEHPSNEFFSGFANCLTYRSADEFKARMSQALRSQPAPLSADEQRALSWDAATERFLSEARADFGGAPGAVAAGAAVLHQGVTGSRLCRKLACGEVVVHEDSDENKALIRQVDAHNGVKRAPRRGVWERLKTSTP